MLKFKRLTCLFLCICGLLSACSPSNKANNAPASPPSKQTAASSELPLPPPVDPEIVSPIAVKDFMDVEEFSWQREFPVEFIMLHFCSGVVIDKNDPFSLELVRSIFEGSPASINYIIDRDGTVYCWIPEQRAAWHAGKGSFGDEKYTDVMNKYSIGIELLAIGSKNDMKQYLTSKQYSSLPKEFIGFTDAQYESLSALLSDIISRWSIPADRRHIIGHDEYKPSKTDPGELFDWDRVMGSIA